MAETLDDVLVDNAAEPPSDSTKEESSEAAEASETTSQPEATEEAEKPETVESEEAEKPETEEEGETSKDDPWTKTAYLDEKRKRQEYARQLEEANQAIAELKGQKPAESTERPDVVDDPDGYALSLEQGFESRLVQQKIEMSQVMARQMHDDYDLMESAFVDLAKQNPVLVQQMNQSAHPAEFVYQTAKQHLEFKDFQSGDLKAKMMAEIRAELKQELEAEQSANTQNTANLSKSLINESSASGNDNASIAKTIDDIL